jgi:hypothetical protein
MKTPDQLKDDVRNRRFLGKGNVISLMNDTKWIRFFDGLIANEIADPIVRMKYVRDEKIRGPCHMSWSEIKATGRFELIEWIEFQVIESVYRGRIAERGSINHRDDIIGWLRKRHIPFEETGEKIVVFGHKVLPI